MYSIDLKPRAVKDLRNIPKPEARRIVEKIKALGNNLSGDVKRLTNYSPEYKNSRKDQGTGKQSQRRRKTADELFTRVSPESR